MGGVATSCRLGGFACPDVCPDTLLMADAVPSLRHLRHPRGSLGGGLLVCLWGYGWILPSASLRYAVRARGGLWCPRGCAACCAPWSPC
jgi:hypothetical protein